MVYVSKFLRNFRIHNDHKGNAEKKRTIYRLRKSLTFSSGSLNLLGVSYSANRHTLVEKTIKMFPMDAMNNQTATNSKESLSYKFHPKFIVTRDLTASLFF